MRITEKKENGFYELKKGQEIYGEENGIRLVQIVGKYEDIEKELGIDLVKLFNAVNQRPWTKYENEIDQCDSCEYMFGDIFIYFYWKNGKHLVFELKDYGKTWALTKEELEK